MFSFKKIDFNYEALNTSEETKVSLKAISSKFISYSEKLFNHQEKFNKENFIEIELKKSFIKNLICFDPISSKFCNLLLKDLKNKFGKNIYFKIENPSIMVHLSQDFSEEGTFHYDQIGLKETITIWTPITDYKYKALSYYSFGSFLYKIFKILSLTKLFNIKYIQAKKFCSLMWGGYFIHKGNKNTSENKSAAIILTVHKVSGRDIHNSNYFNFSEEKINTDYRKINELLNIFKNEKKNNENKFIKVKNILEKIEFSMDKKVVSRVFSIFAQRIYKLNDLSLNNLAIFSDISAYNLDKTNYASNKRLTEQKYF
tara:strand:- start:629 stop:1570 length:942 start_codon:yes stop_codon:yes gene_type:complete